VISLALGYYVHIGIGIRSLWSGLSASILRQTTYSTARFALYDILARNIQRRTGGKLSTGSTIACAGVAGGLAGMIGNPTEVTDLVPCVECGLNIARLGCVGAYVCRRCEGAFSEILVFKCNQRNDSNWQRRRPGSFH
jgi:hypothetical protein